MSGQHSPLKLRRIVSGGQTGVDRGALDAAIQLGIAHGGWCPRGRLAEDGTIPRRYQLAETDSPKYHVRTLQNVLDADGTLILFRGRLSGGTELTHRMAVQHGKPHLLVDLERGDLAGIVRRWLVEHEIEILNVAGPRESTANGVADQTRELLCLILTR